MTPHRGGHRALPTLILAALVACLPLLAQALGLADFRRDPLPGILLAVVGVAGAVVSAHGVLEHPWGQRTPPRLVAGLGLAVAIGGALAWGGWLLYERAQPASQPHLVLADFQPRGDPQAAAAERRFAEALQTTARQTGIRGLRIERVQEMATTGIPGAVQISGQIAETGVILRLLPALDPAALVPVSGPTAVAVALPPLELPLPDEAAPSLAALTIGLAEAAVGEHAAALAAFERALASAPPMAQGAIRLAQGVSALATGQPQAAVTALEAASQLPPDLAEVHYNLALAYASACAADGRAAEGRALAEAEAAARLAPSSVAVQRLRGLLLAQEERWAEAAAAYQEALRQQPDDAATLSLLAVVTAHQGDAATAQALHALAVAQRQQAVQAAPNDPEAQRALAEAYFYQGQDVEATNAYQRASQSALTSHHALLPKTVGVMAGHQTQPILAALAYRGLGLTYAAQQQWEPAVRAYEAAVRLVPNQPGLLAHLGEAYVQAGQIEAALVAYRQAVALRPCDAASHLQLASIYRQQSRQGEATKEYEEALRVAPDDPGVASAVGFAYATQGRQEEATRVYQLAISGYQAAAQRDPTNPRYPDALGTIYLQLGQLAQEAGEAAAAQAEFAAAEAALQEALRLQPHDGDVYYRLGIALFQQQRYAEAVTAYQEALRLEPNNPDYYSELGSTYSKLGQWAEAEEAYGAALRLQDDATTHILLGAVYEQQGRLPEAIQEYEMAQRLQPSPTAKNLLIQAHLALCRLYAEQHKTEDYMREAQAILELQPDHAEAHSLLGLGYETQGQPDKAIAEYELCLRYATDPALIQAVRARLQQLQAAPTATARP
jgi:tetratricopeptide (TPR) repeat protein